MANRINNGQYIDRYFINPQVNNDGRYTQDEYRMADLGPPDPLFSTVVYICHWDKGPEETQTCGKNYGSSGYLVGTQATFLANDAWLSTAQKKWGKTSLINGNMWCFSGSTSPTTMAIGTNDFALECWVYYTGAGGTIILLDMRTASTNGLRPVVYLSAGNLRYSVNATDRITSVGTLATGWHHIIVARSSGTTRLGVDGVQVGADYVDANNYTSSGRLWVGIGAFGTAQATNQHFDSVRLSIGTDRGFSGATYTAPLARFPDY